MRTYGDLVFWWGNIHQDGERWWIIRELEPQVCIRLKHVFQGIAKGRTAPFRLPDTLAAAADLAWFVSRYPLRMSEGDRARLEQRQQRFWADQEEMAQILSPDYQPQGEWRLRPGEALRPYQARTVALLRKNRALLCADELGLGKTYTGLAAAAHPDALPALVVAEPHLQNQWARRAMAFAGLNSHIIRKSKPYPLPPKDLFIITYHKLAGWVDVFAAKPPGLLILEEAQSLRKGDTTNKGLAARAVAAGGRYVLGLTATPIYNYGVEIYNLLDIMRPGCLGRREDFEREWVGNGRKGLVRDPRALGAFLREAHLMLRHTRKEVGRQLPPVNVILETVDHDSRPLRDVEALAERLAAATLRGSFTERGEASRQFDMLLRQATGLAKAPHVAQYARLFAESGEPVLLAGWHRAVYEVWLKALADLNPVLYTGSESPAQKEASVREFMGGRSQVMIMSLRSGIGLDVLQGRCSTVVFGELDWSPKVHEQLIGRVHRDGQRNPVMAVYLTSEEGSDPTMIEVLGVKAHQAQGVTDPLLAAQPVHSDPARVKALARDYLARRGQRRAA
ncbi:MAG: DEAD/DEAH box helicase [Desulfarculus sp.]|nr:MAG: DEAD/DEAH box helicase [Desulfarculus sp.]